MNPRLHLDPPAPPPFWQSEQLVDTLPRGFDSLASASIFFGLVALCSVSLFFVIRRIRNRRRFDARAEERGLRAVLEQNIGPGAAWLSSSAIAGRLGETGGDESTSRTLERLKAIEMQRFGPGLAESVSPLEFPACLGHRDSHVAK